jgi:hypothetical protein
MCAWWFTCTGPPAEPPDGQKRPISNIFHNRRPARIVRGGHPDSSTRIFFGAKAHAARKNDGVTHRDAGKREGGHAQTTREQDCRILS